MAEFEPKEEDTPYASFASRLIAYIIDNILVVITIGLYGVYWLYRTAIYGDSVGKKAVGIQIVDTKGNTRLGLGTTLLREVLGRFIDYLFLSIGALWMLIDNDSQAIHDKVAKTYVVKSSAV